MDVTVSAFGFWQMMLRIKRMQIRTEGTLLDLIKTLNSLSAGDLKDRVLTTDGDLDAKFKIFVNGRACDTLATKLAEGDDIVLYSVIDGG